MVDANRGANDTVFLLWFEQERDDCEDCELLVGVCSSEVEARSAIERLKDQKGFASYPEGFRIYPRRLNADSWREGFVVD